jgi:hypothetical protein
MDLHLIEQPCPKALLRGVGAVQHHVTVTCGGLCLRDARLDAVGDEPDAARCLPVGRGVGTNTGNPSC